MFSPQRYEYYFIYTHLMQFLIIATFSIVLTYTKIYTRNAECIHKTFLTNTGSVEIIRKTQNLHVHRTEGKN